MPLGLGGLQSQAQSGKTAGKQQITPLGREGSDVHGVGCMKPQGNPVPAELFQRGPQARFRMKQKGVVVEGKIHDPSLAVPLGDLPVDVLSAPPFPSGLESSRRTVRAAKGASPARENRDIFQKRNKVPGGRRQEAQVPPSVLVADRHLKSVLHPAPDSGEGVGDHQVGPAGAPGMVFAQPGVNAAQPDGDFGKNIAQSPDGLLDTGIPIGHHGGHPDEVRFRKRPELLSKALGMDAVAVVKPGEIPVGGGLFDLHFGVFPGPVPPGHPRLHVRMGIAEGIVPVKAIHQGDLDAVFPQEGRQGQQTQGFGPQIVGGKIRDPGVDQKDKRSF